MFAVAADYLMGWSMAAADGARKQEPEWPPHPDRLFMALAAAWFETGCDDAEGAALRWLEALSAPAIAASDASHRTAVMHYVPVNDAAQSSSKTIRAITEAEAFATDKAKDAGLGQLPPWRGRQPRAYPVAIPQSPVVHFIWSEPLAAEHRPALGELCAKVTRIGHSASLVQAWLDEAPPAPAWLPGDGPAGIRLRISGAGRLDYLRQRLNRDAQLAFHGMQAAVGAAKGKAKAHLAAAMAERFPVAPVGLRPEPGLWQDYVRADRLTAADEPAPTRGMFDPRLIVLALRGQRLDVTAALRVTTALRGALLSLALEPLPEWLSGHSANGAPTREPHLALLPLPFCGSVHADGHLMGVALALPGQVAPAQVSSVLAPMLYDANGEPRTIKLYDAAALDCGVSVDVRDPLPASLNAAGWTGPSRRWATVTPIVLDRHIKGRTAWEGAAEVVADACERIGLPRPIDVLLHPNALLEGVPPARQFTPLTRKRDGGRLAHSHAVLTFDANVVGPVVIGAGRFRGYGLCRPVQPEASHG